MDPCTWIDVVTRFGPHDYMQNNSCKDPTYLRNVKAAVDRWLSCGVDVALFHFEDYSTSIVPILDIPNNASLKKALEQAKENVEGLMVSAFREGEETLGKLFFEHLRVIIKLQDI